jgi:hypothetical protein
VQPLIKPTSQNVNAILLQTGIASGAVAQAAIEQRTYWQKASANTVDLIGDAQDAVKSWGALGATAKAQIEPTFSRFQTTLDRTNTLLATSKDQVVKVVRF